MAVYVIGDIQGCFQPFLNLLEHIEFNPQEDTLWFTGDLVNRGPQSLAVLRYIKNLGAKHRTVLGNHDLHLLAFLEGFGKYNPSDTLTDILHAADRNELIEWLRHRPLLLEDQEHLLCHAGIAPMWDSTQAHCIAREVESVLQGDHFREFLQYMYGNKPDKWDDNLQGMERLRCATNYFTRMRFCYPDGRMQLTYKGTVAGAPPDLLPWFDLPQRKNVDCKIIFGHWAALGGVTHRENVFALDTGCVWGNSLTAMRLSDHKRFEVSCTKR